MVMVDKSAGATGLNALTQRVKRLRESGRMAQPHADGERARLFTESWKETDGQSLAIRRAKAFKRHLEGVTPVIFEGELIVGSATKFRCGGQLPLEYISEDGRNIAEGREFTMSRETEKAGVTEEDAQAIAEAYKFWAGKSTVDLMHKRWEEILGGEFMIALTRSRSAFMVGEGSPPSPKTADYAKLLAVGLKGLITEAQERMSHLDYCQGDAVE
ncbi:MAG: hypothetical protein HYX90_11025, partial [Chloroflexi bacterium]|nr:hypothetical protein [Chloroflexota bacterium]